MNELPADIETLQALVRQLLAENTALKAENQALRAALAAVQACLQADSHNSHKPPAADGLRKRPALPKATSQKRGGQLGHAGKTLKMVAVPDATVVCPPSRCACGASLEAVTGTAVEYRQVFDLPEPKLAITEYQRIQCVCPVCGHRQTGEFPLHVKAPTQYGAGVLAFVALLNNAYLMPIKKIQQVFADLYGYAINEHTILTANATCYAALAPSCARIKAQVQASPVCHFDETGIRVAGTLHWQHVASTTTATHVFVHTHRGQQALQSPDSVLPAYHGWAVHDCWASYFNFSACRHALCGAHLLRELTAVAEQGRQWAKQMHRVLLTLYRQTTRGRGVVTYPERWRALYASICDHAQREEPPPERRHRKGKASRTKGRNLLERLITYQPAVLAFACFPEVPFTNNQAERDLRPVKVKQKIAGCFRTLLGAQHYARISSFISTARKQDRHVFKELRRIFMGSSFLLESVCAN